MSESRETLFIWLDHAIVRCSVTLSRSRCCLFVLGCGKCENSMVAKPLIDEDGEESGSGGYGSIEHVKAQLSVCSWSP